MKTALITISHTYVPRGPDSIKPAFVQIMTWHRTGDKPLSESITPQFTDTYMRLSTIMPGYLLGVKLFPGPMLIYPFGFNHNCTHNEHELDQNLRFYRTLWYQQTGLWPLNLSFSNRKYRHILCVMNSQRQDSCSTCDQHDEVALLMATWWR